jgi:hypothetical protein
MWALYDGAFSGLYGEVFAESLRKEVYKTSLKAGKYNSVDLVMELLMEKGKAGAPWVFQSKGGKYTCERPDKFKGKGIEESMIESVKILIEGWFFFGVSASQGYHSLVIALEKKNSGVRVLWLDQFTRAFDKLRSHAYKTASPVVTNTLDNTLLKIGKNKTRVWPLYR